MSPQCGFASTEEGNRLTEEEQWAKLRFIKEIQMKYGEKINNNLIYIFYKEIKIHIFRYLLIYLII